MAVGDNNEQQNDRQNEQQNQINQNEQQNELNQNINNENEQQQEEVKENPEADQEGHTPGGPEEEKPKAEGPAAEENDREFDLDKLRTDPELWKRICMPLDDEGHMGNVFNGKENPFQKDSAAAMSKVQGLAANGQLYLRGRGTSEFQKVERSEEGTGYKLGDSFEKTENAPYDPVLGTLIRLSNAYFKGIFGRDWFSKAAEKYNNYRAMKAARESEQEAIEEALLRAQEKEEAEKRKQEEEKERAEKEREKAAKEKEKANKKARRFEKKQKEAAEKRRKEVEERERRKEEQREGAEGKKQGENERDREVDPNAIAPQQQEKDASIQAPNQLIEEQKKQFKERLKEENEAWKGTADWKVRTGEKLFHGEGNPELREE